MTEPTPLYESYAVRADEKARVLACLLSGMTPAQAAEETGTPMRTIHYWLSRDPRARGQLAAMRALDLDHVAQRLADAALEAVECLRAKINNPAVSDANQIKASGIILERVVVVNEHAGMNERLVQIERALRLVRDETDALVDADGRPLLLRADADNVDKIENVSGNLGDDFMADPFGNAPTRVHFVGNK